MYALAVVASLLVTLSLASPSIVERQTSSGCATSDHTNFTLLAINSALEIQLYVGLATDQNSADFGWLAVSSLLLSATIVLMRHIFCRAHTLLIPARPSSHPTYPWPEAGSSRPHQTGS
jgi:hypothetical protein